jgi:tetratricopeptide (TPR) repeat protein
LQILERRPHDEGALQRLADLHVSQSNLQATKETLTNYLAINPWQSSYQLRLAAVYGDMGMLDDAARQANESLLINPTLASAHRILAEVYRRRGMLDESEFHHKMYERLEPKK